MQYTSTLVTFAFATVPEPFCTAQVCPVGSVPKVTSKAVPLVTNVWDGEWQDAATGAFMKGFGVELWILRDGKIAVWEAAFNVARADQAGGVAEMLR